MKQAIGFLVVFALLIGVTVGYLVVNPAVFDPDDHPSPVVATIDADVPGTKIFCQGQLLGETPYALTWEKLEELGFLDEEELDPADPLRFDGWGESLFLGPTEEFKISLQAPEGAADRYLTVETPAGRRTRIESMTGPQRDGQPPTVVAHFKKAITPEGFRFRINLPDRVDPAAQTFTVELTGENMGHADIVGTHPEFAITCGDVDATWNQRVEQPAQPLPATWQRIRPGQTVTAKCVLNTPDLMGHYTISATFAYRGPPAKCPAVTVVSNAKLLLVR